MAPYPTGHIATCGKESLRSGLTVSLQRHSSPLMCFARFRCSPGPRRGLPLPHDSAERPDRRVRDIVIDHPRPRRVERQVVVELGRHRLELVQPRPGDAGEVVVLIVESDVPQQKVQRAVVRVRLLPLQEHVVLRNEVPRGRVQAPPQERRQQQVRNRLEPPEVEHRHVGHDVNREVTELPNPDRFRVNEHGANCIEEQLENYPDELGQRVGDVMPLGVRRYVHVDTLDALVPVMLQVVLLERDRHRDADRDVGEQPEEPVVDWGLEREVVGELVDREEEVVVEPRANRVRERNEEPPRGVAHEVRERYLARHHGRDLQSRMTGCINHRWVTFSRYRFSDDRTHKSSGHQLASAMTVTCINGGLA